MEAKEKQKQDWIDYKEVCKKTGIRPSQLNYLVRDMRIPSEMVKKRGHGYPRKYDPEVIEVIEDWKQN